MVDSSEDNMEDSMDSIIGLDINNHNTKDIWEVTKVINNLKDMYKDKHLHQDIKVMEPKDFKTMEDTDNVIKELHKVILIHIT